LHQAFVRLNTGGVSLKGEDQFFAGVKLYWPEAEERLAPLQEASGGLLTHRSALELVARVARLSLDGRDLAPLRLRDLARWGTSERKNDLVQQMRLLSRPRGALSSRLRSATQTLCSCLRERIGGGSAHIGRPQLLASIAWLYRFTGARRAGSEEGIEQLVWMMFWSTAFSSHSYGKARFSRRLMTTAWRHGEQGRPIGRSARLLGLDHRFVRPLFWGEEQGFTHQDAGRLPGNKTLLIGRHRDLFLRLFQGIGPATELEWDHIFPYSRARRLFRREGSRGQIKEFARWVNHPGNLAGIAPRANRVLGDRDLPEKLGWDGAASAESYAVRAFIQTDPNIDADEEQILRDFHSHRAHRDRAGPLFREFVLHRTRRVWDYAVERVGSPPACPEDPADAKRSQK
jgi:hypothetical protein